MDLSKLTTDNWIYFERNYKAAYNFLVKNTLLNERDGLNNRYSNADNLNDYETRRRKELNQWYLNQRLIDPNY